MKTYSINITVVQITVANVCQNYSKVEQLPTIKYLSYYITQNLQNTLAHRNTPQNEVLVFGFFRLR